MDLVATALVTFLAATMLALLVDAHRSGRWTAVSHECDGDDCAECVSDRAW